MISLPPFRQTCEYNIGDFLHAAVGLIRVSPANRDCVTGAIEAFIGTEADQPLFPAEPENMAHTPVKMLLTSVSG
jgi:hypothetical protein